MNKSVYISRKVLNSDEIRAWAKSQGFVSCLPEHEMHITVAFDKKKHDWRTLPFDADSFVDVKDVDERNVEEFRGGAIVLEVYSTELTARWAELTQSGLFWKWPDYRPHVTISYNDQKGLDISKIEPFSGTINLGPEVVDEVLDTWKDRTEEDDLTS